MTATDPFIWGNLIHLSTNLWNDSPVAITEPYPDEPFYSGQLRFDDELWIELTERMAAADFNLLLLDLGDGVRYASHPEIAVEGAWTTARLRDELRRLRSMGIEPIPKLNFSTAHDAWLGPYARQVSTEAYYRVCADLIAEVSDLFDRPRLFHLGMDEETLHHQATYPHAVIRQHDLWWHDLDFLVAETERNGARAWVWSDYAWAHPVQYYRRMPKSVLQSNWHYELVFTGDESGRPRQLELYDECYMTYLDLDELGYDQIATSSTWRDPANFALTAEFCRRRLEPSRFKGLLQTTWKRTEQPFRDVHLAAIDAVAEYRKDHA